MKSQNQIKNQLKLEPISEKQAKGLDYFFTKYL